MGYQLQAVVASASVLRTVATGSDMPVCELGQGLALMPITERFHDRVSTLDGERLGFWLMPGGFGEALAAWSLTGPVAYVEAESFGGVGEQRAALWDRGALALGPLHCDEGQRFPSEGSPISQVLRRLGAVRRQIGDEFDAVGLGRHRDMDSWFEEAGYLPPDD